MRLKRKILSIVARLIPNFVVLRMMANRFGHLGIEPTNICNANCTFCGYRFLKKPKFTMSLDAFKRTIDEYAADGGGVLSLTPTVGDPLVDGKILEKIRYARSNQRISTIFLYTNAILLDKFGFENVLNSGISRLAISTYIGSSEGYKRYYGKDEYLRVVRNIIGILKCNQSLGNPVLITLHLRCEGDESIWKNSEDYKEIASYLDSSNINYLKEYDHWGGLIEQEDIPNGTVLQVPLSAEEKSKSPCFEMYRRVHILANGNVGVCVCRDMEGEINIGHVEHEPIIDMWRGDKLKQYRSDWVKGKLPKVCVECTRYEPVDDYINSHHRTSLIASYLRRKKSGFLQSIKK